LAGAFGNPGQAIQLLTTNLFGIFYCGLNPFAKLRDPLGKDGNTALAGGPIARRKIKQYLDQLLFSNSFCQDRFVKLIGEEKPHAVESRRFPGSKPLMNGNLVKSMLKLAANFGTLVSPSV
jgi:hypothetical protein